MTEEPMPDRFAIVFEIDALSLSRFARTGARVVLAKHGGEERGNVAWLAWEPSGSDTVTWQEAYGLYAAEAGLRDGDGLCIRCATGSAMVRAMYPFNGRAFGAPERSCGIPDRHYDVRNESADAMTFGLLQSASVNGTARLSAVNAVVVPATLTADFVALTTVSIWLQPGVESGEIVRVPPAATVLSLDARNRTVTCVYDPSAACFVPFTSHGSGEDSFMQQQIQPDSWSVELAITPAFQKTATNCGPACVQMMLSLVKLPCGVPSQGDLQLVIDAPANDLAGLANGDPYGVAFAASNPCGSLVNTSAGFGVIRANDPGTACAAVVRALRQPSGSASAVCVLAGGHWIVVYGGQGVGDAHDLTPEIDVLWICNPDDGWFSGGTPPGTPKPPKKGFIIEQIVYPEFLRTYFTPAPLDWYPDGLRYVAVCGTAALPNGQSTPPQPPASDEADAQAGPDATALDQTRLAVVPDEDSAAQRDSIVAAAMEGLRATGISARFDGARPGEPRTVRHLDGGDDYYLVPFVRPDGYANVVRLDAAARYLGAAFDLPYPDLYRDHHAEELVRSMLAQDGHRFVGPLRADKELVWRPSVESTSPYNPFYRVCAGDTTAFVSLGGRVTESLHDLASRAHLRVVCEER